jgi:hypothetical protein
MLGRLCDERTIAEDSQAFVLAWKAKRLWFLGRRARRSLRNGGWHQTCRHVRGERDCAANGCTHSRKTRAAKEASTIWSRNSAKHDCISTLRVRLIQFIDRTFDFRGHRLPSLIV